MNTPERPSSSKIGRLYKTIFRLKIRQVIFTLGALAILLYILNYVGSLSNIPLFWTIFTKSPFPALADACLTSAIVGFTFELFVRSESEASLMDTIKEMLRSQTIAILDGIPGKLMLDKKIQKDVFSKAKLEDIILTALQTSLSDDQMGEGIFNGLIRKAIAYEERWSNYRYEIFIEDIRDEKIPVDIRREYFDAIMQISYNTVLRKTRFIFTCVSTLDQFNEFIRNTDYEVKWLLPPSDVIKYPDETTFQVQNITVDDVPLEIAPDIKQDGRIEIICDKPDLASKIGQNVTISYAFKVKAEKTGKFISTTVIYPTYDVTIEFNFAKASISYVDVLDYFVSARKPSIKYIPNIDNPYKISVQLKEWAFPKGGAVFVWTLKAEEDWIEEQRKLYSNK